MHAETLRETWSVKTTVCRILSCRRQLFEIVWDDRRRESLRGQNSRARSFEPQADKYAGGHRIRVTPVPIPNTEVKPDTADGTARETVWESRSLPAVIQKRGGSIAKAVGPFSFSHRTHRQYARHQRLVESRTHKLHGVRKAFHQPPI